MKQTQATRRLGEQLREKLGISCSLRFPIRVSTWLL